jgi:hypothetical protein
MILKNHMFECIKINFSKIQVIFFLLCKFIFIQNKLQINEILNFFHFQVNDIYVFNFYILQS